ncbi:MAG: hypothetical protein K2J67_03110 [Lachnospiraceae bacterium]|nr:hypothetical protein [Lachnospiraceae bacterium]
MRQKRQAKKKGSATLTAQKGKKKASVKIQVTSKTAAQTNTAQVNTTDPPLSMQTSQFLGKMQLLRYRLFK